MDPNITLAEIRALTLRIRNHKASADDAEMADDAVHLGELVDGLDAWLSNGGFLPMAWRQPPVLVPAKTS